MTPAFGEQFSDAYLRINPRRVVPTLVLKDGAARVDPRDHGRSRRGLSHDAAARGVAKALSLPLPENHPASQRWYALVAARPSMAA